ncbi:hypothetical protein A1O7_06083 [Cladophialophora yegresii CBS 114405]|uniref:Uncharacterized protein n=1 Tax=Cladophialophora yegresii CBS 114405 TaxID=1182544 RepID=W9W103_9EURO|nr:uncharacterized protein A1O7_06083 [Cladophialophora yegresii CBS 114405]EXJ58655.1 hypothetical protein A1O7_06083 [Cladophialophora yegresii CBS 114405]
MPGHVAQMQRLFQNAKASLRLDVRFASSPVGSIDLRLPTSPEEAKDDITETGLLLDIRKERTETPSKNWRYSRTLGSLAGLDTDVREPFPEGSPQLPAMLPLAVGHNNVFVAEPLSSGFTSPLEQTNFKLQVEDMSIMSSPPMPEDFGNASEAPDSASPGEDISASDLEHPMTKLRVDDDLEMDVDSPDESPIIAYLKRKSVDVEDKYKETSSGTEERIVLSPSARAAADSAKLKRGLFTDLFPKPPTHKGSSDGTLSSSSEAQNPSKRCPDPLLHEGGPAVVCPDPTAHFVSRAPNVAGHHNAIPIPNAYPGQHIASSAFGQPAGHFNRATATGSPMPLLKTRPSPVPTMAGRGHGSWYPPNEFSTRPRPQQRQHHHHHLNSTYISTASEHFQPGWYYAKDSPQSSPRPRPTMYSFSTAAAKVIGHNPAPDSMIRDSYRTDTLTPLAKPPSRFRKNGMSAIASARGAHKHHGGAPFLSRPPQRRMHSMRARLPDSLQFRSSPPRFVGDPAQVSQPRKRSRDLVSPTTMIHEDKTARRVPVDPRLRLEEGEEMIEVDEQTRAAVRMSLFGAATPETGSEAGSGLQELSPNVMLYRKGTGPCGSRKKRRPSYWDGDLEEVVRSPAARHVVSSPIKKDDVRSLQADVEFHEDDADKENHMQAADSERGNVARLAEGPMPLRDAVGMENQDICGDN